jgi:hypothetical protein
MNAIDILRNKQIDGDENDLERCVLRADTEGYCNEAYNAAAELAALTAERDVLLRIKEAAINLQSRLDEHFGGFVDESDWKEQAELRAALKAAK